MAQHPKVTVGWTVACLESAMRHLGDTAAERRVRLQFHQLVVALERDGYFLHDQRATPPRTTMGRVLPITSRRVKLSS